VQTADPSFLAVPKAVLSWQLVTFPAVHPSSYRGICFVCPVHTISYPTAFLHTWPAVTQLCRLLVAQAVNHSGSCHSAVVQKLFAFRQVSLNQLSRHLFVAAAHYSNCLYSCSLPTSCPIAVPLTVCSKCCLSSSLFILHTSSKPLVHRSSRTFVCCSRSCYLSRLSKQPSLLAVFHTAAYSTSCLHKEAVYSTVGIHIGMSTLQYICTFSFLIISWDQIVVSLMLCVCILPLQCRHRNILLVSLYSQFSSACNFNTCSFCQSLQIFHLYSVFHFVMLRQSQSAIFLSTLGIPCLQSYCMCTH
jgi:hypothetical protein